MKTSAKKLASVRRYRLAHPEKVRESNRRSYANLRAKRLEDKRRYFQENKPVINVRRRDRLRANPAALIEGALRRRVNLALKSQHAQRSQKFRLLVGCSASELRQHIESLFVHGMSWANRSQWHIDHIRPCRAFDLTDPEQQRLCFHFSNLQPLWSIDNLKKGAK